MQAILYPRSGTVVWHGEVRNNGTHVDPLEEPLRTATSITCKLWRALITTFLSHSMTTLPSKMPEPVVRIATAAVLPLLILSRHTAGEDHHQCYRVFVFRHQALC